jgi:hypothetical protein
MYNHSLPSARDTVEAAQQRLYDKVQKKEATTTMSMERGAIQHTHTTRTFSKPKPYNHIQVRGRATAGGKRRISDFFTKREQQLYLFLLPLF